MTSSVSADWLSIRQASRLLGAHIGTVRDWANTGLIPSYRTPGGHRRFSRVELQKFLDRQIKSKPQANPTEQALTRVRAELRATSHTDWLTSAPAHSNNAHDRAYQKECGQRLLACVVDFVEEPNARERLLDEGRRTAREYGRVLMDGGVSAGNAARATIRFRQLILKTVLDVQLGSRTGDEEDARLFERVSAFLDEILLAIVEAYP